jgi:hypothetical protein
MSGVWVHMQMSLRIHQHLPQQIAILSRDEHIIPILNVSISISTSPNLKKTYLPPATSTGHLISPKRSNDPSFLYSLSYHFKIALSCKSTSSPFKYLVSLFLAAVILIHHFSPARCFSSFELKNVCKNAALTSPSSLASASC